MKRPERPAPEKCVRIKTDGERCKLWPIRGATVCHKHGGRAPQVRQAAARRMQEQAVLDELERIVTTYGVPRDVDPGMALLEEVHRTAGHVQWLGTVVADLEREELKQLDRKGFEQPAVWVQMYERERSHLARVAADAVRCGLEARQVALAERLGEQVLAAMRGFAQELGHDPDDPKVVEAGVRHLRAVQG